MNIRGFLLKPFLAKRKNTDEDLQKVREAAERDADIILGTYMSGFNERICTHLGNARDQFLGLESPDEQLYEVIDAQSAVVDEAAKFKKPPTTEELMETYTVKELRAKLAELEVSPIPGAKKRVLAEVLSGELQHRGGE